MNPNINEIVCQRCNYKRDSNDLAPDWQCPKCGVAYAKGGLKPAQERISNFFLTTETTLQSHDILERIEVISSECAFGMNFFKDMFAGMSDVFGGRNKSTQKVLRDARRVVLDELKKEAMSLGADAVIGIDLDYSEFSGNNKSMLFLVATGTAVKIQKNS